MYTVVEIRKEIWYNIYHSIFKGDVKMSFQDDLLRNLRTKEEVETANQEKTYIKAVEYAQSIYVLIKETLIHNVNEGNSSVSDGVRSISCVVPFPNYLHHYLRIEDKSITIPGTPSYGERQLQELLQAPQKKRKAIVKKYQGLNLDGGGTQSQYIPCVRFGINTDPKSECGYMIENLKQLAEQDRIKISLCVLNTYTNETYPFCEDIKDVTADRFKYSIAVVCESVIPETYSTDKPINIIDDDAKDINSENVYNIDRMEGHQFEHFCAHLLSKNGFVEVDVTKGSGDQGIDIIAYKDGVKFGIQCKCYSSDVGNKAVQEAYAGKTYYSCHVGAVLTNRYFTHSAIDLSNSNGILLWDRGHLLSMIKTAGINIE